VSAKLFHHSNTKRGKLNLINNRNKNISKAAKNKICTMPPTMRARKMLLKLPERRRVRNGGLGPGVRAQVGPGPDRPDHFAQHLSVLCALPAERTNVGRSTTRLKMSEP
jgi:hypothetical protein